MTTWWNLAAAAGAAVTTVTKAVEARVAAPADNVSAAEADRIRTALAWAIGAYEGSNEGDGVYARSHGAEMRAAVAGLPARRVVECVATNTRILVSSRPDAAGTLHIACRGTVDEADWITNLQFSMTPYKPFIFSSEEAPAALGHEHLGRAAATTSNTMEVECEIPHGVAAGGTFRIEANGQTIAVTVPQGMKAGQTIRVAAPAAVPHAALSAALPAMTAKDLKALAAANDLDVSGCMEKADLVALLEAAGVTPPQLQVPLPAATAAASATSASVAASGASAKFDGAMASSTVAVHLGFFRAAQAVRSDVRQAVLDAVTASLDDPEGRRVRRLAVSGHSLGGALAVLLGIDLAHDAHLKEGMDIASGDYGSAASGGCVPVAVTTFGAPCVGTAAFGDRYLSPGRSCNSSVTRGGGGSSGVVSVQSMTRVVLRNDPVPRSLEYAQGAQPYRHAPPEASVTLDSGIEAINKLLASAAMSSAPGGGGGGSGGGSGGGGGWSALGAGLKAATAHAASASREDHGLGAYWAHCSRLGANAPNNAPNAPHAAPSAATYAPARGAVPVAAPVVVPVPAQRQGTRQGFEGQAPRQGDSFTGSARPAAPKAAVAQYPGSCDM